ncbi:hypothetical protein CA13_62490 [Planctomycetes bacterium CA13]|uniref:Uncharacterized protein n=1 Tax=Novipirellula herctigrandis TaxID=2527986 RepID=A0A5C5ZBJ5_9BACT|nr:hypothetical protein CA13_62490 [Planctomycetes bacterium CA13]
MKTKLFATCLLLIAVAGPVRGDDAAANQGIDKAAVDAAVETIGVTDDPIFAQYVDLSGLAAAWTYLDADAMADMGIGLAHAERILFRKHPAIESKDLLKIAVRTASVTNKPEVLKKLGEFAESQDNEALSEQVELASQLAGASRAVAPMLSLDNVTLGAFIAYKQAQHDLDAALVFGSVDMMKELGEQVAVWQKKDPAIWNDLYQHITEEVETMEALGAPSRGGPDDVADATESLNQLTAVSRWGGQGFGGGGGGQPNYGGGGQPNYGGGGQPNYGGGRQPNYGRGGWQPGYGGGSMTNQQTNIQSWQQQQIQPTRPGAVVVGGLLSGLGHGLGQKNPQKNAVASGLLQGLGAGFIGSAGTSITTQGGVNINQRGQTQNWGGGGMF